MIRYPLRRLPCRFGSTRTQIRNHGDQRFFSTKPDDIAPEASQKTRSRLERVNGRLPLFLQRYTKPLLTAPLTHVSSFLLLHELTAIVPLIGLIATFHYTHWLPPYISQGEFFSKTVEKTGTYMRKKGWLGEEGKTRRNKWWSLGEGGSRLVVEYVHRHTVELVSRPQRKAQELICLAESRLHGLSSKPFCPYGSL